MPTTPSVNFAKTRWTLVLQAGGGDDTLSRCALEELCRIYWMPLYAYVRRHGHSRPESEDLVQGFIAMLLQRRDFKNLDAARGRFRAFLLASLKHYLSNARDYANRQKRGGGPGLVLDWEQAERFMALAVDPAPGPDVAFDREWALALLARVLERLRGEWAVRGKLGLFDAVKVFLTPDDTGDSYLAVSRRVGEEAGALRVMAHRLRRRYRELLKEEVAQTLSDVKMLEEELRLLLELF